MTTYQDLPQGLKVIQRTVVVGGGGESEANGTAVVRLGIRPGDNTRVIDTRCKTCKFPYRDELEIHYVEVSEATFKSTHEFFLALDPRPEEMQISLSSVTTHLKGHAPTGAYAAGKEKSEEKGEPGEVTPEGLAKGIMTSAFERLKPGQPPASLHLGMKAAAWLDLVAQRDQLLDQLGRYDAMMEAQQLMMYQIMPPAMVEEFTVRLHRIPVWAEWFAEQKLAGLLPTTEEEREALEVSSTVREEDPSLA